MEYPGIIAEKKPPQHLVCYPIRIEAARDFGHKLCGAVSD